MAAYEYYRNSLPGWGTSQFQFGAPPVPAFQPQPSWTGLDFFNAHAYNPDPSLYQSVMGRLGSYSGIALDHHSAQQWHYMIYSGLTPLTQALPADVGGAAAYEVYRTWKYNASLYAPLSADRMMQREGLIGMSIAEATRLWQYTGRPMDVYGQRAACEAAAATAAHLADRFLSYAGTSGAAIFPPSAVPSPYAGMGATLPVTSSAYGTYPYAGSSISAGYSPRLSSSQGAIAAPPGSTVVVTHPRHRSHSRHRHSGSHSDDEHHHHLRRRSSVEIIQTGGGGGGGRGRYGYVPYGAGYAAPGYATTGYAAPGYVAPGYAAPGYAPGYGGGYGGGYGYPSGCVLG